MDMVFKQGVLRFRKIMYWLFVPMISSPLLVFILFELLISHNIERVNDGLMLLTLFFPLYLFIFLLGLSCMEWFRIYEDRIEAVCVYGKKNTVYFKDVLYVEELKINETRYAFYLYYIFYDGRKNNKSRLDINSCFNKKKFNFRIYKTDKLEDYITNVLKLEIVKKEKKPWER